MKLKWIKFKIKYLQNFTGNSILPLLIPFFIIDNKTSIIIIITLILFMLVMIILCVFIHNLQITYDEIIYYCDDYFKSIGCDLIIKQIHEIIKKKVLYISIRGYELQCMYTTNYEVVIMNIKYHGLPIPKSLTVKDFPLSLLYYRRTHRHYNLLYEYLYNTIEKNDRPELERIVFQII